MCVLGWGGEREGSGKEARVFQDNLLVLGNRMEAHTAENDGKSLDRHEYKMNSEEPLKVKIAIE